MARKPLDPDRVSKALGSSRVVPVAGGAARVPLDLLHLRVEIQRRLQSSGGRPTDPRWTMSRVVRFQPSRWRELERYAEALSAAGRTVSPSQLAAVLVERGLAELCGPSAGPSPPGATPALPRAVDRRLRVLLERQQHGEPLTEDERAEAAVLARLADLLSSLDERDTSRATARRAR